MYNRHDDLNEGPSIHLQPMVSEAAEQGTVDDLLALQLAMTTSSINHEYARMEFEENSDCLRREELLRYMHDCRTHYLDAREKLVLRDPTGLLTFEHDLIRQKQLMVPKTLAS